MGDGRIQLRVAEARDAEAVQACVVAAYSPYLERMDRTPAPMLDDYERLIGDGLVWVAEISARLTGAIVMWPRDNHLYVDNIAVHPDSQGIGIGHSLLGLADLQCRNSGLCELRLYTNEVMMDNMAFYERRGYVETHRAVDRGYRRVFYSKKLPTEGR